METLTHSWLECKMEQLFWQFLKLLTIYLLNDLVALILGTFPRLTKV